MSNLDRSILSIIEPDFTKIILDEISIEDTESEEAKNQTSGDSISYKASSYEGAYIPTIFINSTKFEDPDLIYVKLDLSGKIPTISASFEDRGNKFSINSPIDGDVISFYLRPPDENNQKPIRIDFNVTSISSNINTRIYNIYGEMKIPNFYREICKSFSDNTSINHLTDICEELGLGLASNETSTDDSMTRICAYDTYEIFIDDLVFTSYKDDDSFFDWYIDPYYFLCFVNIHKQFSIEKNKPDMINISSSRPTSISYNEDIGIEDSFEGELLLTNLNEMSGKNVYIKKYSINNNSGSAWKRNGYKRFAQWMNIEKDKIEYQNIYIDPLTTPGAENDFILLKGRVSDGDLYKKQIKYKWLGKQCSVVDGGFVHDNFHFSKLLNHQNLEEINKTTLEVEISGMNFYLYKYMRVPVSIYENSQGDSNKARLRGRNEILDEGNENPSDLEGSAKILEDGSRKDSNLSDITQPTTEKDQIKNEFLSGFYVIKNIKYIYYADEGINTQLTLTRREWPIPSQNKGKTNE